MAKGQNATNYEERPIDSRTLDKKPTREDLEKIWRQRVKQCGLRTAYNFAKERLANKSINGADVAEALEFLASVTNDPAFKTAVLALHGYGLAGAGLKQDTLRLIDKCHGTASWFAMPHMSRWVHAGFSVNAAAERTAAQLGIAGSTFGAVVEDLRKTYPIWIKAVASKDHPPSAPDGNTGRKLKVRLTCLAPTEDPGTEIMGVQFNKDGFGVAPDTRDWRRLINHGQVALYGVVEMLVKT